MPSPRVDPAPQGGRPRGSARRAAPRDINAPPPPSRRRGRDAVDAAAAAAAAPPARPPKRRAQAGEKRDGDATPDDDFVSLAVAIEGDAPAAGRRVRIRAHTDGGGDGGASTSAAAAAPAALVVRDLPFTWRPPATILRALMSNFGAVAGVAVDPADARSAVVLFEGGGASGVQAALAAARAGRVVGVAGLPDLEGPIGLKAWVEGHKALFPGTEALQAEVDAWMAAYDAEEARKAAAAAAAAASADDGWTVVVRGGGRKKTSGPGGVTVGAVAPAAAAARAAAAKPLKVDTDFYRFQRRDARRNELAELREKFEEDKRRIAELRANRRFRPG